MKITKLHDWDLAPKEAIALQKQLAEKIIIKDQYSPPRYVAGVDVGFEENGKITRAAVAVLEYPSLELVEKSVARTPTSFPYIPGLLSFREIPVILKALKRIHRVPGIILCDGQGIAHPRRFGLACHLGLILNRSTIGVGKSRLIGSHDDPADKKGSWSPLFDKKQQVGVVLRTRTGVKPLYVSPGHKISMDSSIKVVMSTITRYRLPETTRHAHRLASS